MTTTISDFVFAMIDQGSALDPLPKGCILDIPLKQAVDEACRIVGVVNCYNPTIVAIGNQKYVDLGQSKS